MGLVLLLLAVCLPSVHSARQSHEEASLEREEAESWLETYEAEVERRLSSGPKVPYPSELKAKYPMDAYLGSGSFGESWLVTNRDWGSASYGQKVVMKLLYSDEGVRPEHLTWRIVQRNPWFAQAAREAARECEIASDLRKQGEKQEASGAAYVMNCFGHNVPSAGETVRGQLDTPLFLLLENCGGEDLTKFMRRKAKKEELSVELVTGLFKQILEGLDFRASLEEPWLHHDLKPDNVVVKSHQDGSYTAHLIDFGATVKGTQAFMCKLTACTPVYAPKEWGLYKGYLCPQQNFEWSQSCDSCGTAFDMFSASAILFELVTGSRLYQLKGAWGKKEFAYSSLETYAKNPELMDTAHITPGLAKPGTQGVYSKLMAEFLKPQSDSAAFFKEAMAALRTDASKRPTAATLLKHTFLSAAPVTKIVIEPELVFSPENCRFQKGNAVEYYHYNRRLKAKEWVKAEVEKLMRDDQWVYIKMEGVQFTYAVKCADERLRPLAQEPSQEGGFRPAVGSGEPGFDAVTRVTTDGKCPGLCTQCEAVDKKQYICWSPTALDEVSAAKWLNDHNCMAQFRLNKKIFGRSYYGYPCSAK